MRSFYSKSKILRLRVIGNSDSPADQARKLSVRDRVLPIAMKNPNDIAMIQETALAADPGAKVCRGIYSFGGYTSDAIVVTLGMGEGKNWWGILFPSAMGVNGETVQFDSWLMRLLKGWGWI